MVVAWAAVVEAGRHLRHPLRRRRVAPRPAVAGRGGALARPAGQPPRAARAAVAVAGVRERERVAAAACEAVPPAAPHARGLIAAAAGAGAGAGGVVRVGADPLAGGAPGVAQGCVPAQRAR